MSFIASTAAAVATVALAAANLGPPRVVVWPPDAAPQEAAGDYEPVESSALVATQASVRAGTHAQMQAVDTALEQTKAHYLAQEFETMERTLAGIEERSLDVLALPGACDALWEVEFRRGLAALGRSQPEVAQARFRLAAALRPDRRPDLGYYGPDVAQAFTDAFEAERAAVELPLQVDVTPADATRVIDCVPVQTDLVRLSSGLHVVWTSAPGHRPHAEILDVSTTPALEVTLDVGSQRPSGELGNVADVVPVRPSSPSARALLWRFAREVDADAVVWLEPSAEGWMAQLQVADARGKLHRAGTRAEAIEAALRELGPDGSVKMVAPAVTPKSEPSPPTGRPRRRTWWIWTIAGGVVVTALAVGLAVGLGRASTSGPSRQTIVVE